MADEPANIDPAADPHALEEQLVAYLDGELDDASSRRIEELLASHPNVRDTLEKLEGTWDLLDSLGRAHIDEVFTRSTLEMVAVAATDDVEKEQAEAPRRRRRRWLIGGAGLLAAGAAGFLAVLLLRPDPNRQLLDDLPVLERLDEFRQIDRVEFLELLLENQEELFPQVPEAEGDES
jgi:anti-sigma factor RsiW